MLFRTVILSGVEGLFRNLMIKQILNKFLAKFFRMTSCFDKGVA